MNKLELIIVVYCDCVASGKPLHFIEKFILEEVLPMYGNTHTTTSVTSLQTTLHRHEAKDIIRNAVNASEHDAVLFCGSGATAAVHKLISALNFHEPPVVFLGPFEHHSNFLPWKEIGAKVVRIPETPDGSVDLPVLEEELKNYQTSGRTLVGTFSAASNVTGILTDDIAVTALLHKYGALAFWDYACAGPYVGIDMNPVVTGPNQGLVSKDAIFLSPHKFVGGPDTPGLLIAKKKLFKNSVPSECGGGTVFFVSRDIHRYLQEAEMREEGGTPSIVGAVRTGLVFQLKEALTAQAILARDQELCQKAFKKWSGVDNLVILGSTTEPRLPIFSFVVQHAQSGLLLHHNYVCALLNDLFGIQTRGGCACAGPYAQDLLGIDEPLAQHIEKLLAEDRTIDRIHLRRHGEYSEREVLRPGFCRLNLPYYMPDADVNFVLEAVSLVAIHGWKLLPLYMFNPETGEWKHQKHQHYRDRKWLGAISYNSGEFVFSQPREYITGPLPKNRKECLQSAKEIFETSSKLARRVPLPDQTSMFDDQAEELRWFVLPSEARAYLFGEKSERVKELLFQPVMYPLQSRKTEKTVPLKDSIPDSGKDSVSNEGCQIRVCPLRTPVLKCNSSRWVSPSKIIFKPFLKAVQDFGMVKSGDRILVCLSGGKDSLSLLHTMRQFQIYSRNQEKPVHFDLGAVTVDPQTSAYDPSPLKGYLASLGLPYFYEEQGIIDMASQLDKCKSICSFCSRMKRGRIYACARREGYNVLAFGQHLDDLAESFIMSVFHNGRLRTMKANYSVQERDLRVIRPLAYVREKNLRKFAEESKLPVIPENCPGCFEAPKERHRTKQLLAQQEVLFPKLFSSLQSSLLPLMSINRTGMENGGLFWLDQKNENSDEDD